MKMPFGWWTPLLYVFLGPVIVISWIVKHRTDILAVLFGLTFIFLTVVSGLGLYKGSVMGYTFNQADANVATFIVVLFIVGVVGLIAGMLWDRIILQKNYEWTRVRKVDIFYTILIWWVAGAITSLCIMKALDADLFAPLPTTSTYQRYYSP